MPPAASAPYAKPQDSLEFVNYCDLTPLCGAGALADALAMISEFPFVVGSRFRER
jgi:hypothetical protein